MLFSSLIFIYLFLPVSLVLAFIVPPRLRNHFLLLASLVFYAWGGVVYLSVLVGSILLNYFAGAAMYRVGTAKRRNIIFVTGIVLNLLILVVFKYTNFLFENVNVLTGLFGWNP